MFKAKAVYIRFWSQLNVLNHIPHNKIVFNTITSYIAIIVSWSKLYLNSSWTVFELQAASRSGVHNIKGFQ